MKRRPVDMRQIVADASSVWERLSGAYQPAPDADRRRAAARLEKWKQSLARDDESLFHNRLRWSNVTEDALLSILDTVRLPETARLPSWSRILEAVSAQACRLDDRDRPQLAQLRAGTLDAREPLPFEDFFVAHVLVARRLLARALKRQNLAGEEVASRLLSGDALGQMERALLERLSEAGVSALHAEFQRFKAGCDGRPVQIGGQPGRQRYEALRSNVVRDGFVEFYSTYPALGRLHATLIKGWVAATCEFILRLDRDAADLADAFLSRAPGPVIEVRPGLSSPFDHGRTVVALRFQSGLRLVYKPKSVATEQAVAFLLSWLSRNGAPVAFQPIKVLDKAAYGWVEYVSHQAMTDPKAVERFYYRAGALTALLHLLQATDCHCNNLIASGEHLQLIDTEAVCQPNPRLFDAALEADSLEQPESVLARSVTRTLMIPGEYFKVSPPSGSDWSALGAVEPARQQACAWTDVNHDTMRKEPRELVRPPGANAPSHSGQSISPFEYLPSMTQGFRDTYRFLLRSRDRLLQDDSPLAAFADVDVRFVLRKGAIYHAIMNRSLTPENLRQGADRSIAVDLLARAFIVGPRKPHAWPIVDDEIRSVERLDVPCYRARTSSTALQLDSGPEALPDYFRRPSYQDVRQRLAELDEQDLELQSHILESSFHAKWICQTPALPFPVADDAPKREGRGLGPPCTERWTDAALWIARRLRDRALVGRSGAVAWLGTRGSTSSGADRIGSLDDSLPEGRTGIALFLAALDSVLGTTDYREMVAGAVRGITERARGWPAADLAGGHTVYALCRIADYTQDEHYLVEARQLAGVLGGNEMRKHCSFGVLSGAAGAILNLLTLYQRVSESWILDKAIACGEYVLEGAVHDSPGESAHWLAENASPWGMAHGAAGIALALLRLYGCSGQDRFRQLAEQAFRYEHQGRRSDSTPEAAGPMGPGSWCCGAAGLGLARLAGVEVLAGADVYREIEQAAVTSLDHLSCGPENLCCGVFARAELLNDAADLLGRNDWRDRALGMVEELVGEARGRDGFRCDPRLPRSAATHGFLHGHAGVGYHLLRLAHPGKLARILTWE